MTEPKYFRTRLGSLMSFSIHYRSTETMHPAQAYAIKQHAQRLTSGYVWSSFEPLNLRQLSDGHLTGQCKPRLVKEESDSDRSSGKDLPPGTVLSLATVLCTLSREHSVDWDIGHDYEPDPIGRICGGEAEADLIEQLEVFGGLGDLLDNAEVLADAGSDSVPVATESRNCEDRDSDDDEGPRLLRFPDPKS